MLELVTESAEQSSHRRALLPSDVGPCLGYPIMETTWCCRCRKHDAPMPPGTCLDATQACLLFQPPPTPPRSTYVYLSFGATENACPCIYLISIIVWVSPSCCVCSLYNEDTAQAALRLANVLLKEINLLWHRKYKMPHLTFNYAHERFILLARILMGPVLWLDV